MLLSPTAHLSVGRLSRSASRKKKNRASESGAELSADLLGTLGLKRVPVRSSSSRISPSRNHSSMNTGRNTFGGSVGRRKLDDYSLHDGLEDDDDD